MKTLLALLLTSITFFSVLSQNTKTVPATSNLKSQNLKMYRNAVNCGDYLSATVALNYIVALEPNTSLYRDSLALLYFMTSSFHQSIYWCEQILFTNPNNFQILEIKAASYKNTKQYTLAITDYEKLIRVNPNPFYVYNLLELQYQIKRLYECINTSQLIDNLKFTNEMLLSYLDSSNQQKSTHIKVVMLNYTGMAYLELGKFDQASKVFDAAFNIDSTYIGVLENKIKLNRMIAANEKTNSNQVATPISIPNKDAIKE